MNVLLKQNMNKMSESELYDALYKDPVFECYNRRAFMEVESKWVVVVDVDSLKWLNDTYGHRVGDHYMKEVIDALIKEFGEDSVFRLGGDEFAVILPQADEGAAFIFAERLRQRVEEKTQNSAYAVTISVGVAGCAEHEEISSESLLKKADEQLYRAKKAGRNKVCATNTLLCSN